MINFETSKFCTKKRRKKRKENYDTFNSCSFLESFFSRSFYNLTSTFFPVNNNSGSQRKQQSRRSRIVFLLSLVSVSLLQFPFPLNGSILFSCYFPRWLMMVISFIVDYIFQFENKIVHEKVQKVFDCFSFSDYLNPQSFLDSLQLCPRFSLYF